MECDELREYKRKVVSFKDFGRFKLLERRYNNNSLNIYTARLNDLREDTLRKAKLKWGKSYLHTLNFSQFNIIKLHLYYCIFYTHI